MKSLKGHLLVATPRLLDPNFARTVLLMLEHNEDGAAGVVLNRPTERTIAEIAGAVFGEELDWPKPIHVGGPVPGPVLILHDDPELGDSTVIDGVYTTVDSERLMDLLRRQQEPSLVLANYAGWGPGQLESELDEDSWRWLPATSAHIFWDRDEDLWETAIRQIGHEALAAMLHLDPSRPIDPTLN